MCLNCTLLGECPSFSFLSYPIYKLSPGDENANSDTNTKLRNERPLHSFLKLYLYLSLYLLCLLNALRPLLGSTFFKGVPLLPSFSHQKHKCINFVQHSFSLQKALLPVDASLFQHYTPAGLVTNSILLC